MNNENSYLYRNFAGQVKEEELQVSSLRLGDEARIWCYEGLFGENCYFEEDYSSQTLYADRICYDTTGGIFYYRAEGKYYPVQKVSIRVRINYVDLLEKTDIQNEDAKEYLEVLERQSARLKSWLKI